MVVIYYDKDDEKVKYLRDRLKEMVVKHELVKIAGLTEVELMFDKDKIQSFVQVKEYLDELEILIKSWYECRCDKYEF
jgi:hypothetical protein